MTTSAGDADKVPAHRPDLPGNCRAGHLTHVPGPTIVCDVGESTEEDEMRIGTTLTYLNDDGEWTTGIVTENDGDPIVRVMHDGQEYAIRIVLAAVVYY